MNKSVEFSPSFENSSRCQSELLLEPAASIFLQPATGGFRLLVGQGTNGPEFQSTDPYEEENAPNGGPVKELSSMRSEMIAAGMPDPGDIPSDDDLRLYFGSFAPGHGAIRGMRFADAAAFYRWLAVGTISAPLRSRNLTIARQLDLTQQMKHVCGGALSFPPTGEEVESYFLALAVRAVDQIQSAFEDYVDSFFILSQVVGSGRDVSTTVEGVEPEWCTQIPAAWQLIQSGRLQEEGRRILDPVGHALLGKKCLEAAGFSGGHFAVASRRADLSQSDSLSTCLMFTASRIAIENRRWSEDLRIEVVVVANGSVRWASVSAIEVEAAEEVLLWSAFQKALDAPLGQAGRIAQERVVRLGSRGQRLSGFQGGPTTVRVSICYPASQPSAGNR
jgi:hypothetical protein